jgi:hypothetical protein
MKNDKLTTIESALASLTLLGDDATRELNGGIGIANDGYWGYADVQFGGLKSNGPFADVSAPH